MYRLARRYIAAWAAATAVIICWLASPVVFFMYVSPPWSHVPALCMTTAFIATWLLTRERSLDACMGRTGRVGRSDDVVPRTTWPVHAAASARSTVDLRRVYTSSEVAQSDDTAMATPAISGGDRVVVLCHSCLTYQVLNGQLAPSSTVSEKFRWTSPHFFDTLVRSSAWRVFMDTSLVARRRSVCRCCGAKTGNSRPTRGRAGIAGLSQWRIRLDLASERFVWISSIDRGNADLRARLRACCSTACACHGPPCLALGALLIAWNIGLIAQWSIPPRPIKDGLVWNGMLQRQFGVARTVAETLTDALFRPL